MLRYGEGDVSAFEVLYQRNKDRLFRFLLHSGCGATSAEDIAQDTWSAVIGAASRYRHDAGFRTWLYTIARRKIVDDWRRRKGTDTKAQVEIDESEVEDTRSTGRPLAQLQLARLLELVEALPLEQREVFLLKEEGFSLKEIAGITETGVETAKSRLRYARDCLREGMGVSSHAG
jgi:RNA polymerase sigma-70 factor (ECF subfamily)